MDSQKKAKATQNKQKLQFPPMETDAAEDIDLGSGTAIVTTPLVSAEKNTEVEKTTNFPQGDQQKSEEDLGNLADVDQQSSEEDIAGLATADSTELEPTQPVPTKEVRPALQWATIDKVAPSATAIAEEHRQHVHELAHKHVVPSDENLQREQPASTETKQSDEEIFEPAVSTANTAPDSSPSDEDDLDATFAQLLSMGFDVDLCERAIGESIASRDGMQNKPPLLDMAVAWICTKQGEGEDHVRGISYSPHNSPTPSRPPPRDARPSRSILKPASTPAPRQTPSIFTRSTWFNKQIDQASNAFASTLDKVKPFLKQLSSTDQLSPKEKEKDILPSPKASIAPVKTATPTFVIAGGSSNDSLDRISSQQDDWMPGGRSSTASRTSLNSSKSEKHVRFSFPDVRIGADMKDSDRSSESVGGENQSPTSASSSIGATSPSVLDSPAFEDWNMTSPEGNLGGLSPLPSQPSLPEITTAEDLLSFYIRCCETHGQKPIEKVVEQLKRTNTIMDKLDISSTALTPKSIPPLTSVLSAHPVTHLTLQNATTDDESLKLILTSLLTHDKTVEINLTGVRKIKSNGIKYISVFAKKSKSLRHLILSSIPIDTRGISYLSHALKDGSGLSTLELDNCDLSGSLLRTLAEAIPHSTIQTLTLRSNKLTKDSAPFIAAMLQPPPSSTLFSLDDAYVIRGLRTLDISSNAIGHGLSTIATALLTNSSLVELRVRENRGVGGEAFGVLVDALKMNNALKLLDFSHTSLGSATLQDAITTLKSSLTQNTSLTHLILPYTGLTTSCVITLAESLPLNKSLQHLDFRGNGIGVGGIMALSVSLRMNEGIVNVELLPLGEVEGEQRGDEEELARFLNDVEIYCHRNNEIQRARGLDLGDDNGGETTPTTIPRRIDMKKLENDLSTASETSILLTSMLPSGDTAISSSPDDDELIQHLYNTLQTLRPKLHTLITTTTGTTTPEDLLGKILETYDQTNTAMECYNSYVERRKEESSVPIIRETVPATTTTNNPTPPTNSTTPTPKFNHSDSLSNLSDIDFFENSVEEGERDLTRVDSETFNKELSEIEGFLNG